MKHSKILMVFLAVCATATRIPATTVVIANKGVDIGAANSQTVGDIYRLESAKTKNGTKIVLFDVGSASRDRFYAWLGQSLVEFKKTWMKKQLAGEGKAPVLIGTDAEVVAKVASTPGAIGYVDGGSATDAVKVLFTIP